MVFKELVLDRQGLFCLSPQVTLDKVWRHFGFSRLAEQSYLCAVVKARVATQCSPMHRTASQTNHHLVPNVRATTVEKVYVRALVICFCVFRHRTIREKTENKWKK